MASNLQTVQKLKPSSTTTRPFRKHRDVYQDMLRDAIREVGEAFHQATTELQAAVKDLSEKLTRISATQLTFVARMDEVKNQFVCLGKQTSKNTALINSLSESEEELRTSLKAATRKLNHIEQMSVDTDVIISNVEKRGNDDDKQAVTKLCTLLDIPDTTTKIASCYRLRSANSNRISPIVVRFDDQHAKQTFVAAAQKKRVYNDQLGGDSRRRVFVNHRMTNTYQEIDRIIRERGVRCGYTAWYTTGRFFLRNRREHSPIEVRSTDDLPLELTADDL